MSETIFALSSGRPPAAIAVVRVSGPKAHAAGVTLAGKLPLARTAGLRRLRDGQEALDHALVLFFPGPNTATGEDLLELHLHGGRAVVAAVEAALARQPGLRPAQPGEFTRRSLLNGRIDLAQAEGLADLLEAETEAQRRGALSMAEGELSRSVETWLTELSIVAARVEAELDFSDEGEVAQAEPFNLAALLAPVLTKIMTTLARPSVERLRDGVAVVLAGPRNAGKSSLFNALLGRPAAIVTDVAGTTRDVLEAVVTREGLPFRLVDTAGLAADTADPIEAIGIERAKTLLKTADVILWLGEPQLAPPRSVKIAARADEREPDRAADLATSIHDPSSVEAVWRTVGDIARQMTGDLSAAPLHARQRQLIASCADELKLIDGVDLLIDAERLRIANAALAAILGRDATEAMLDALFGRFCLGK